MREIRLSPSMMCAGLENISDTLRALEEGGAKMLHIDVMDGHFVPNLALGTDYVRLMRKLSPLPVDLHLMVERPENVIPWFDPQPGEYVAVHVESTPHIGRALMQIRALGAHPLAAINPSTPLCALDEVLSDIDGVLVMCVHPGFAGQKLVPSTVDKVRRLRQRLDDVGLSRVFIEVDGNVSFENIPLMYAAGATAFVGGTSSVFHKGGSIAENMAAIKQSLASLI